MGVGDGAGDFARACGISLEDEGFIGAVAGEEDRGGEFEEARARVVEGDRGNFPGEIEDAVGGFACAGVDERGFAVFVFLADDDFGGLDIGGGAEATGWLAESFGEAIQRGNAEGATLENGLTGVGIFAGKFEGTGARFFDEERATAGALAIGDGGGDAGDFFWGGGIEG